MAEPVTLNIKVQHLMPTSKKFFIFQEPPKVDDGPGKDVFTNVFSVNPDTTGNPDGSSNIAFSWQTQYYAIIGTASGGPKSKVETTAWKKVKLGPSGSVIGFTGTGGSANWDPAKDSQDFGGENGFKFITDAAFEVGGPNHPYLGVGASDPKTGQVIPLQTFPAVPSLETKFYPKLTYYIGVGDYTNGQFVVKKDVGKFVKIDFQFATGTRTANLVYDTHGLWSDDKTNPSSGNNIKLEFGGV